jgi:hypothetical protein
LGANQYIQCSIPALDFSYRSADEFQIWEMDLVWLRSKGWSTNNQEATFIFWRDSSVDKLDFENIHNGNGETLQSGENVTNEDKKQMGRWRSNPKETRNQRHYQQSF